MKTIWGLFLPGLLLGSFISPAQDVFTISDNVNLVLLEASVRNSQGGHVEGLSREDFKVFDNGHATNVVQFGAMDAPVTVGLVVDNSGSMKAKRDRVVTAGLAFAKESNPQDEFFVVNFNNSVLAPRPPFTDQLQAIHRALYYGEPFGQTALYDAMAYSLRHLERGHRQLRTLIIVSDGADNVSTTSLRQLLSMVEASRATIFAVGLDDPEGTDLKPSVLRKLAAISGGDYFQVERLEEIVPVFHKISQDIRRRYTVGFLPAGDGAKNGVHHIKVVVHKDGKNLPVKTRTSYQESPSSNLISENPKG